MTLDIDFRALNAEGTNFFSIAASTLSYTISNTQNTEITEKTWSLHSYSPNTLNGFLSQFQNSSRNPALHMTVSCGGTVLRTKDNRCYFYPKLNLYYTPGCYINIYDYDSSGTYTNTLTSINDASVTLPTGVKVSYKLGYICDKYHYVGSQDDITTISAPSDGHLDTDQILYCTWTKIYKVIFKDINDDILTDANLNKYSTNSVTCPTLNTTNLNKLTETGYYFIGWSQTKTSGENYLITYSGTRDNSVPDIADSQLNSTGSGKPTSNGFEIIYYPKLLKQYKVIFNKILPNATFSYTESNYNNKIVGDTVDTPNPPTINTHQFIGWAIDSSVTAKTAILDNNNGNQNCWTTIPAIADDQAGSVATSEGFPINYYAVWQERDSITIVQTLPNSQVTEPATITVTGAVASNNNTYYFDPSSNISFSVAIKQEYETYFIDSVTASIDTDLITDGILDTNYKTYTSGQIIAGTNSTAITITITYIEGLSAFYPDEENSSKRALMLYWENIRAIDLYYENTRLL